MGETENAHRDAGIPTGPRRKLPGSIVVWPCVLLGLYVSWQLSRWIPGSRRHIGDLLILPIDATAAAGAWWAARRCSQVGALRSFWRLLAFALAAETLGDLVQAIYDIGLQRSPYPSLSDVFYLAFYPLLLAALLRVPAAAITRARLVRTLLDGATIVVGGGAVVWYFVLGPTAEQTGQSVLAMAVSMAFPVGDLFLLAGLAAVLLRSTPATLHTPLRLIAVAVLLGIVADVLYGYGQLHGTYIAGGYIDTLYVLEFTTFAFACASQRPVRRGDQSPVPGDLGRSSSRASWVPYLSVAIGLGVLLGVERSDRFFPNVSLVLIVIVLAFLVSVRQYLAQQELLRTQVALRSSERAKDEFLSIIGHELRTPLTSIRGSLGLLEGGVLGELPEQAAEMVAVAVHNTTRLMRLINDVLDIERMTAGHLELQPAVVDGGALVRGSIEVLESSARASAVTLHSRIAPVEVLADADRVIQTLVNLAGNAVKFSSPGGVVTVAVAPQDDCALFSVSDDGRGIPAGKLEHIFERFGQVDASDARERGGTGLGLPIARGIVERHGGQMWVVSRESHGSTFYFTLPLSNRPSESQAEAPHQLERVPR